MRILYAGDSGIGAGFDIQGFSVLTSANQLVDAGKPLQQALEAHDAEVSRLLSPNIPGDFPETAQSLAGFDIIILSDVSYDSLMLYTSERRQKVPMGPNRLKEIASYVEAGGNLVYCGGYLTFQGFHGLGRWHNSPLGKALPVDILPLHDDRIEVPEGTLPRIMIPDHPIVQKIPWQESPLFLGYNKATAKPGSTVIAQIGDDNDPLMVCWSYGKGKVLVFTSDPVPHWGNGFVKWPYYGQFWGQVADWMTLD